ncbi:MAG: sugar ABC transporter substrate-binding protein, partial [Anaerolineae bacterium]|nr:sugar ABC transporter substrate-binding protein [Anaerolineae bacterium]
EKEVTRIATAPPAPKEKVHIRYTTMTGANNLPFAIARDERFMKVNPDVEVEQIAVPYAQYQEKILTMLAGGDIPDVTEVDGYWMLNWVGMGTLRPLDDYLAADKEYTSHKVVPNSWPAPDHQLIDGKIYSKVQVESTRVVYFNETAFKEAGLKTPIELVEEGKWDWTAYLEAALKLTKGSGVDKVYGALAYPLSASNYLFIHSNGGLVLSEDKSKCIITMPETIEAIQFQIDLILKHDVAPLPAEEQVIGGGRAAFMTSRTAMCVDNVYAMRVFNEEMPKEVQWAVAALPTAPQTGYYRTWHKPNAFGIPTAATSPDAAWRFLAWDPIGEERIALERGSCPAFEENVPYFYEMCPAKNCRLFLDDYDAGNTFVLPLTTKWTEMSKIINDEISLARIGEKTVDEAVKAIEPQVNALLA